MCVTHERPIDTPRVKGRDPVNKMESCQSGNASQEMTPSAGKDERDGARDRDGSGGEGKRAVERVVHLCCIL